MTEKSWFAHIKKTASFAKKHALLLTLILIIALQFVPNDSGNHPWGGMWMRMQSQELHVAERAAKQSIDQFVQAQAAQIAQQQYPNLPSENRQKVISDLADKVREDNKGQIEQQQEALENEVRQHYMYEANGEKFVYMPDIDPYHYLRLAKNAVETGYHYDTMKEGVPWDTHMLAPLGRTVDPNWHPYVFAMMFNVHSMFSPNVTLMQSAAYFPIVFMFLSIILAFFVGQRLSGNIGGFFAATMLAILPAIIGRTPWGHGDTDVYNVFFPLLALFLLIEALRASSLKKQLMFGSLTGASIAIYTRFWAGWWYLYDLIAGALIIAFVIVLVQNRKKLKEGLKAVLKVPAIAKVFFIGLAVFLSSLIVSVFTIGPIKFLDNALFSALTSTQIKNAASINLWPNVLTTVAELNPASFNNVLASVGGSLLFAIGIIGIIGLLLKRDKQGARDVVMPLVLLLWFAGTIYMSFKGTRFILLLGPAFAIAFGAGVGLLTNWIARQAQKQFHIGQVVTKSLIILIVCLIIVNPTSAGSHLPKSAYNSVKNDVPIMNDAWWDALTKIKEESNPNAIINSWWDYGHHFKFVADRAVTFDGATQNTPQAHWIGRALQTSDEKEAVAILRMLDCGANSAFERADAKMNDPLKSVSFVKELIMLNKSQASARAKEAGLPGIVELTHCDPPEDYFIASGDMIGKAGVWSHFGLWDFQKAEVWNEWRKVSAAEAVPQMAERFDISEEKAQKLHNEATGLAGETAANKWISPWLGYITTSAVNCKTQQDLIECGNNIAINMTAEVAEVRIQQGIAKAGQVVVYGLDGEKNVLNASDGSEQLTVLVWPRNNREFKAIAAYAPLADSMFTRMYFMDGLGLEYFDQFADENQLIGGAVKVYKVDWTGGSAHVPEGLEPKDQVEEGARVAMNYIGWTDEGIFDSSIADWKEKSISQFAKFDEYETTPLQIVYGQSQLIAGFTEGIKGMKEGETKTLTIPPEKGYGTDPSKHELGNKTLNFKVEIVALQ